MLATLNNISPLSSLVVTLYLQKKPHLPLSLSLSLDLRSDSTYSLKPSEIRPLPSQIQSFPSQILPFSGFRHLSGNNFACSSVLVYSGHFLATFLVQSYWFAEVSSIAIVIWERKYTSSYRTLPFSIPIEA